VAHDIVFSLQEDAQRLIDAAAGPAEQRSALGANDSAEAFDINAFELNAIVDINVAKW
jgi:hypothetical protein